MSSGGQVSVAFRGVSKTFTTRGDTVVAVDGIDLDIGEGEFFSMLGPSGCGKTTMLRMVAGLDHPTGGSIEIFGAPVADVPAHRRPVNTVFQHYALFPHMDVTDNVGFGLRMQKVGVIERRRRVGEALELVRLDGLSGRRPAELSGGQQQRVALARALVNRPRVLLLDEPLGALDQKLRVEMQQELTGLQRELGITFVFVTHDQAEALTMSDRIAVMRDGRILQLGTADDVYERPTDRFVADFIGDINTIDGVVADASTIALATGERIAGDVAGRAPGTEVSVAIRPERLRLAPVSPDSADGSAPHPHPGTPVGRSLRGRVDSTAYLGNASVVRVCVDWVELTVRVPASAPIPEAGETVDVSWEQEALLVLEPQTSTVVDTADVGTRMRP
ncbi:MAG: ABC transporter ATP-binding protein [Actinomycetota bacterium]